MAKVFYDQDVNWDVMKGEKIAIIGYGSQGHAHALNLMESGLDVTVGLYEGSKSAAKARAQGLALGGRCHLLGSSGRAAGLVQDFGNSI